MILKKTKKGFTLVEVAVAFGVLFVLIFGLLQLFTLGVTGIKRSQTFTIGQNLAQLQMEDLKSMAVSVLDQLVKGLYDISECPKCNYPADNDSSDARYDSGLIASDFYMSDLENILGVENSPTLPTMLLPSSIKVEPYEKIDYETGDSYVAYRLILHKETFPPFKKRIIVEKIEDNPLDDKEKVFKITIQIFWKDKGKTRAYKLAGEKGYNFGAP